MEGNEAKKNIYAKMAAVKIKLLGIKKTGKAAQEKFSYAYFELGDILQVLLPALKEEGLHAETTFSAQEKSARLVVTDIDDPEKQLRFETPVPDFPSARMNPVQALGAAQTYMRRYLLMTAFDIAETDIIDGNPEKLPAAPNPKTDRKAAKGWDAGKNDGEDPVTQKLKQGIWNILKGIENPDERASLISRCRKLDKAGLRFIYDGLEPYANNKQAINRIFDELERALLPDEKPAEELDIF